MLHLLRFFKFDQSEISSCRLRGGLIGFDPISVPEFEQEVPQLGQKTLSEFRFRLQECLFSYRCGVFERGCTKERAEAKRQKQEPVASSKEV